jgi:hypothetical protein
MAKSKKNQQNRRRTLKGGFAEYPGSLQTKSELAQFGSLPGNTWASGLGKNPGLNDQMSANTTSYQLVGSGKKKSRRSRKQRR